MRKSFVIRVRILLAFVLLVGVLLVARLYVIQIVHGEAYVSEAQQQYVRGTRDIFDRGLIYFSLRTGERIAAASVRTGYLLAINPTKIENPDDVYQTLSGHIQLDERRFMSRATREDDPYEEVARHIEQHDADAIADRSIPGVQLFREKWRYYPGGALGAHALGFVGYGDSVLERQSDGLYVNFFAEVFANVRKQEDDNDYDRSGHLITTIEPAVQQALERTLHEAQEMWNAHSLGGIVMDPKTGAVYALAAMPSFDPNNLNDTADPRTFRNPLVENVYEMGSIIKPIAMAIGLDTGAVTSDSTYNDTGSVVLDTATISNYDGRARGVVNMQEVLNQSLNVGMAHVAKRVGGTVLGQRMRDFGFGEETGIDLPFEVRGLIDNLTSPREVEYATASFGQGIALTPIATALSPETSREITRMLVEVVDTALRGGDVRKERYSIAAKTGTAQIAKAGERGYYDDRFLHSFFGYFPAYEPQFMIFLFHVEPQGARYASETLTDPFMGLVDFLINYYEVPPDR